MGEHHTWFSLIRGWDGLEAWFEQGLRRDWEWWIFRDTHFTMVHVAGALLAILLILVAVQRYRASLDDDTAGVVPSRRFGLATMLDGFVGATHGYCVEVLGERDATRYLPFVGTLALFVFASNLQGLVPGLSPPTNTLKTNAALALAVFGFYNVHGIWRHGWRYVDQFVGPKFEIFGVRIPLLFWFIGPIEVISHIVRPFSLAVRLMANMVADHKVVVLFASMCALVLPVPFLVLGTMVAIVQTLIFTLLTIIYLGMAVGEAEH